MGGGDLNSKKSWHPNTIKNQERVWKAEQAAALEKKRITELQKERSNEKERSELNDLIKQRAGTSGDSRLNWMYDKPDKEAQSEDYLLGKEIGKNYGNENKTEENAIPAVARRVVGSSMIASSTDTQVDLARKLREDPLLLVKERERAARAALLNNPLHRRRIAELLRKEQEQKKNKKEKKKDKDLDNMLAAKLSAFGDVKGADIAKLLASDDSSSDSDDSDAKHKKKKHKNKKSKKEAKQNTKSKEKSKPTSESSEQEEETHSSRKNRSEKRSADKYYSQKPKARKRKSSSCERDVKNKEKATDTDYKKRRRYSSDADERENRKNNRRDDRHGDAHRGVRVDKDRKYVEHKKKTGLTAEEKASRLAAMAAAGAEREVERGRRVAEQRRNADRPLETSGPRTVREAHALPDSLEARIHSNRHYIQRGRHHMNENFAKR